MSSRRRGSPFYKGNQYYPNWYDITVVMIAEKPSIATAIA